MFFLSERQEEQILQTTPSGPFSIRLTWRYIQSSQGYRLEWREEKGQTCTLDSRVRKTAVDTLVMTVLKSDII